MLMTIVSLWAIVSFYYTDSNFEESSFGLLFQTESGLIGNGILSLTVNLSVLILISLIFVVINHQFQIVKRTTWYFVGLFFIMQGSMPGGVQSFSGSTLMTLIISVCTLLLFSLYGRGNDTRKVFLIFCLLMTTSLWVVEILYFIVIFLVGCAQVKIFNFRTILASLFGIMAPMWVIAGLDWNLFFDLKIPDYSIIDIKSLLNTDHHEVLMFVLTGIIGIVFLIADMITSIGYNDARRTYNGFLSLVWIVSLMLCFVSPDTLGQYFPLLNILTSFQIAHYYSSRNHGNPYMMIFILILYCMVGVWNFL